jgi:hypothetical protein
VPLLAKIKTKGERATFVVVLIFIKADFCAQNPLSWYSLLFFKRARSTPDVTFLSLLPWPYMTPSGKRSEIWRVS